MAALTDEQRSFLADNPFTGTAVTLRSDGSPHATAVWVDTDGESVMFNTAVGRAKEKHLRRDPRVALMVIDPQNAYRWISVSGRAELTTDGADEQIDKLARKYLGKEKYPRRPGEERITVRISPEKIDATGLDGDGS